MLFFTRVIRKNIIIIESDWSLIFSNSFFLLYTFILLASFNQTNFLVESDFKNEKILIEKTYNYEIIRETKWYKCFF
jgi:hypothetical protein